MDAALPFVLASYPLCLAGVALAWLFRGRTQTPLHWLTHALACGSVVLFVFLAGTWAFTSYYLRYIVLGLYALAAVSSYRRMRRVEGSAPARKSPTFILSLSMLVPFSVLDVFAAVSSYGPEESLDLSFPLTAGTYYVLQGGNNVVTNPFHVLGGSRLAVDIVKLNVFGNRAHGIAPRELGAYEIFGEPLHGPCSGSVLTVRADLPDNPLGRPDTRQPEGNHVVLECDGARVLLAHLMQGSVRVAPGEFVTTGQPIGRVGNSGNTMEPHLHIAAKKGEAEFPLRFNRRRVSINSVIQSAVPASDRHSDRTHATTARAGWPVGQAPPQPAGL